MFIWLSTAQDAPAPQQQQSDCSVGGEGGPGSSGVAAAAAAGGDTAGAFERQGSKVSSGC